MHIIYLDESGTHAEARYFVVAGLAVFERETYHLAQSVERLLLTRFPQATTPLPLHASTLRAPPNRQEPPFDSITEAQRRQLISEVYGVVANSRARIFAVAMEKAGITGHPYERGEPQRGLVVIAESSYRENLEVLAQRIWTQGHRWGETHNLADIPYFAPAKSTRLLQLADFISNAVFGRYESGYSRDFDLIAPRFDQDEGRIHGLVHIARDRQSCYCPACVARRAYSRSEID